MRLSESIDFEIKYDREIPEIEESNISIIIPVYNNTAGIERFIGAILGFQDIERPAEILVVDNASDPNLAIDASRLESYERVKLLRCPKPGAAAARNMGAKIAHGKWLLFCDSDCVPTKSLLSGYKSEGAIAYAGNILAFPPNRLSSYYDSERTLVPYGKPNSQGVRVPAYLVTANALVLKDAFLRVGGFDESFPSAGGEDVDLARRLWRIGPLGFAADSLALHDFSDGFFGFVNRFYRYGRGNRILQEISGIEMTPKMRKPRDFSAFNLMARFLQYVSMMAGFYGQMRFWRMRTVVKK